MKVHAHRTAKTTVHAYPAELIEAITLKDDQQVAAQGQPARGLAAARFARCDSHTGEPDVATTDALICLDATDQMGFVITAFDGEREILVAEACYVIADDGDSAEFALSVTEGWRGRGFGKQLMAALCSATRQAGVKRLVGEVPVGNGAMLALMLRCGFSVRPQADDDRYLRVERRLVTTQPGAQPGTQRLARSPSQVFDTIQHAWPQWLLPTRFAF
ncbi:N-acetyltransferase family protein [Niveibacterium sp.]|uniref:GNAT family N-acetyltransferase n=1 Tax=Niveibacterium sp. TaxID=2017444 RepID=UPI0035B25111